MSGKNKKRLLIGGGLCLAIVGFFVWQNSKKVQPVYSSVAVIKGNLIQTVSETGTVKPLKKIELSFPQAGKISKLNVKIGDKIVKDQVLAELDYSSLTIKEQEAKAALDLAVNNKNKLVYGATASDLAVLQAQVNQALSAYKGASSDYDKVQASVKETISQAEKKLSDLEDKTSATPTASEQAVVIAQLNLENGRTSNQQTIENSKNNFLNTTDYNISVANTALDKVGVALDDSDFINIFSVKNSVYKTTTENDYDQAKNLKAAVESALSAARLSSTENNFNALYTAANTYYNAVFKTLNDCYSGLENSVISSSFTQTELDTFKTSINAQITAVNTGVNSLQTAKYNLDNSFLTAKNNLASLSEALRQAEVNLSDGLNTARDLASSARLTGDRQIAAAKTAMDSSREAWGVADRQLAKLKAPARAEDINLVDAQIRQAQANFDLIKKQQDDSLLKAPIDGQIVDLNYEVGEQFSPAKSLFVMLTENNFEIEVDISETDISKIKTGDSATITFDAFGESHKFTGQVYSIEPSATVIQGVIYYKVKVTLTTPAADDPESARFASVKPEMTANVTIKTDRRDNVLLVPGRAIVDKNGQGKFIRVLNDKTMREIPVTVGLSGDEGLVEVTSGNLQPGELVVTFVK